MLNFFKAKQLQTITTSVPIHVIFLSLLSSIVHRVSFSEFVQHHIRNNNIFEAFTKTNHKNSKNTVKLARYYKFKEFKQNEFNFGEPCSVQSTNVLHLKFFILKTINFNIFRCAWFVPCFPTFVCQLDLIFVGFAKQFSDKLQKRKRKNFLNEHEHWWVATKATP